MLKTPKLAAANLVSIQSNFPEPHTILATCALKIKSKILTGTVKKIICKNAEENFFSNSFLFCFEYAKAIAGKIAVESETANAFTIIEDKLFAKLNTVILPVISVEAIAVVAMVFNCPAPKPKDLGTINFKVFTTPACLKLNKGL